MPRGAGLLFAVWLALLALLAATVSASFLPLGPVKPAISLVIAVAKAALVMWFFMHLREQPALTRVIALAAVAWLIVLITLTLVDLNTRGLIQH